MPGYQKRYRKYKGKGKPKARISATKKLVTGQTQPTMLEKIASGVGGVAQVANAVLPMIKAINTEHKYFDAFASAQNISSTPSMYTLINPAQGTTESTRIGNSILLKDINIRLSISPNYTSADLNFVRYIIFVDKMQAGTLPTAAQLLTTQTSIDSPFNKNYTDRFVILKDKRLVIAKYGDQAQVFQKIYKKLDFHQRYLGTDGTQSSQGPNSIYMCVLGTLGSNFPLLTIYSRTNYTDN